MARAVTGGDEGALRDAVASARRENPSMGVKKLCALVKAGAPELSAFGAKEIRAQLRELKQHPPAAAATPSATPSTVPPVIGAVVVVAEEEIIDDDGAAESRRRLHAAPRTQDGSVVWRDPTAAAGGLVSLVHSDPEQEFFLVPEPEPEPQPEQPEQPTEPPAEPPAEPPPLPPLLVRREERIIADHVRASLEELRQTQGEIAPNDGGSDAGSSASEPTSEDLFAQDGPDGGADDDHARGGADGTDGSADGTDSSDNDDGDGSTFDGSTRELRRGGFKLWWLWMEIRGHRAPPGWQPLSEA